MAEKYLLGSLLGGFRTRATSPEQKKMSNMNLTREEKAKVAYLQISGEFLEVINKSDKKIATFLANKHHAQCQLEQPYCTPGRLVLTQFGPDAKIKFNENTGILHAHNIDFRLITIDQEEREMTMVSDMYITRGSLNV